jgi:hypothetical protein
MIFAATQPGEVIGIIVSAIIFGPIILWWFYMMTFRTDDWLKLRQQNEELKQKNHERMKQAASGGIKAAAFLTKLFK